MNLESQVTSLELSKKLKQLGVKQESIFVWEYYDDQCHGIKYLPYSVIPDIYNKFQIYSAFTVSELGNILPKTLKDNLGDVFELHCCFDPKGGCYVFYVIDGEHIEHESKCDYSEANARAKMLIYLIENGMVKL